EHDCFLAGYTILMYKYVRPRNFYCCLLIGLGLFMLSVLNNGISRHADPPNGVIRSPVVDDKVAFMYADTRQGLLFDDRTNHPPDPFELRGQGSIKFACTLEQTVLPACYLLNDTDIYVPLRSIETAFELVSTVNLQAKTVKIRQTNVSIPLSKPDNHDATGSYMFFDQYDVEKRNHVKLVLADEGIPLSTQWSQRAYPYPIQIAQFGLSHYSKWAALTQKRTHTPGTLTSPEAVTDVDLLDSKDPHFVRSLHLSVDDRPTVYRFS
ncbi:D-glucuronyl C5-epimerase, partial [Clonorchis sinensis]